MSYWSVLFKATGFADLLSRMDFINEIVEHDQSVIDQLRTLRQQLAQDKADLEQHQEELTASKTELDAQVAEATRVFEEYAASEAGQPAPAPIIWVWTSALPGAPTFTPPRRAPSCWPTKAGTMAWAIA